MSQQPPLAELLRAALDALPGMRLSRLLAQIDADPRRLAASLRALQGLVESEYPDVPAASVALDRIATLEDFADVLAGGFCAWSEQHLDLDLALPRFDRVWDMLEQRGIRPSPPDATPRTTGGEVLRRLDQAVAQPLRRWLADSPAAAERERLERLLPVELRRELLPALAADLSDGLPRRPGREYQALVLLSGCDRAFGGRGSRHSADSPYTLFERFLYDELNPRLDEAGIVLVVAMGQPLAARAAEPLVPGYRWDGRTVQAAPRQDDVESCRAALAATDRATDPKAWASAQAKLGHVLLTVRPTTKELEREAIDCCERALEAEPMGSRSHQWAMLQANLGAAHGNLAMLGEVEHWDAAESHLLAALDALAPEDRGPLWRNTALNYAEVALAETGARQQERLRRAVTLCEEAVASATKEAKDKPGRSRSIAPRLAPREGESLLRTLAGDLIGQATLRPEPDREDTQHEPVADACALLGRVLLSLRDDQRSRHVERAIDVLTQAVAQTDRSNHAKAWADRQRALGYAWAANLGPRRQRSVERGVRCLEAALDATPLASMPDRHVVVLCDLSLLLGMLPPTAEANLPERSVQVARAALAVEGTRLVPAARELARRRCAVALLSRETPRQAAEALALAEQALAEATDAVLPAATCRLGHLAVALALMLQPGPGSAARRATAEAHLAEALLLAGEEVEQIGIVLHNRAGLRLLVPGANRAADIEACLDDCAAARRAFDAERDPHAVAAVRRQEAQALTLRPQGSKAANVGNALAAATAAFELAQRNGLTYDAALAQWILGLAWRERPDGDRDAHLLRALECFETALAGMPADRVPLQRAAVLLAAGTAWAKRPDGRRRAHVRRAMEYLEPAATTFQSAGMELEAAATQLAMGEAEARLGLSRDAEARYRATLTQITREDCPIEWARAQHDLGDACTDLGEFDRALACYEAALTIRTPEWAPHDWAATQVSLGLCCAAQPGGDREASLHWAIECFEAALTVFTMENMPHAHGTTQSNLGRAWSELGETGRAAQCRAAAAAGFEAAGWVDAAAAARAT